MWRFSIGLYACLFSGMALAQTADQQMLNAMRVFRPMQNMNDVWSSHMALTEGLSGKWLLSADALLSGNDGKIPADKLKRACENVSVEVTVSRYQFQIAKNYKRKDGGSAVMQTVYSDHGGNVYGFMTDPEQYLERLGMENVTGEKILNSKYLALKNASGQAHVFRPSPDVLVIVPDGAIAQFALRCRQ